MATSVTTSVFQNLHIVFSRGRYVAVATVTALLFYLLNIILPKIGNIVAVSDSLGPRGFFNFTEAIILGYGRTIDPMVHFGLIVTSVLTGVFVALVLFKVRQGAEVQRGSKFLSSLGIALGILAPSCSSCGFGVFAAIGGAGVAAHFLPLHGFELFIISIVLLGIAIRGVSRSLGSCKIPRR